MGQIFQMLMTLTQTVQSLPNSGDLANALVPITEKFEEYRVESEARHANAEARLAAVPGLIQDAIDAALRARGIGDESEPATTRGRRTGRKRARSSARPIALTAPRGRRHASWFSWITMACTSALPSARGSRRSLRTLECLFSSPRT